MDTAPPQVATRSPPGRIPLSPIAAILMALSIGLCVGYLDLVLIALRRLFWNREGYFRTGQDFLWTVPLGHALVLLIPGLVVGALNQVRPEMVSYRGALWLYTTLGVTGALVRMPLYIVPILLLAAGCGRVASVMVNPRVSRLSSVAHTLARLVGLLILLAAVSSGRQAFEEYRTVAGLPLASSGARNVVLIVWDTVRSYNLSLYGYPRDTTPNLTRWAAKGVRYDRAMAPAPWTYPSHGTIFTGRWPFQLNTQWNFRLDTPDSTLAEYLTSRGYQTAGFAANTNHCSYETGLARGFAHFVDYALIARSLLSRTVPGTWILKNILSRGDFYAEKWIGLQSLGARELNQSFVHWLDRRRVDRPFFAFLNYYDAHDPYIPPAEFAGRFGIRAKTARDYRLLFSFEGPHDEPATKRDILMARDNYDDCIAFLDQELGRLLDELERQGLLASTDVIITSDHGEAFGDHGTFGHNASVNLDETGVPLVILSPTAPAGHVVESPVSLRDLPATVVDLLGLSVGSPFPGRSLAAFWGLPPEHERLDIATPAFSEHAVAAAFDKQPASGRGHLGFEMSLVAMGRHYIRDGTGTERLYDLRTDPFELANLMDLADGKTAAKPFRAMLLNVLTDDHGTIEVENAYLKTYRQTLKSDVEKSNPPPAHVSAPATRSTFQGPRTRDQGLGTN